MKIQTNFFRLMFALVGCSIHSASLLGQGFVNLDFESATIVPVVVNSRTYTQFGPAFPGWAGYLNASALSPVTLVNYNDPNVGTSALGVQNQNTSIGRSISNFTAVLQGGTPVNDFDVSLAQTGLVPSGTLSLRFQAFVSISAHPFMVSLNGQPLAPVVLQDFGTFKEYGANIPSFAGQTAELRFTQGHGLANFGDLYLDNISFSNVGVPEPGTWALLTLGGALLWCSVRRRRK